MAKVIIYKDGFKRFFDDNDKIHRADGPAMIHISGWKAYSLNGRPYSIDGNPTDVYADGSVKYYNYDFDQHTISSPASGPDGHKQWWENGSIIWPKL